MNHGRPASCVGPAVSILVSVSVALAVYAAVAISPAVAAPGGTGAVSRTRLANGLTLLVRENRIAPVVAISLQVKMGTRWETRDDAGISNLLQLMLIRGTTTLNGSEIVEAADRMGGTIEALGDADFSEIAATALSRYWVPMLELVANVALHPSVPEATLGGVREFLQRQIRNRSDKPYDVAIDALTDRIYGDHPYSWDPIGLKESLDRIDRPALLAHYARHYVARGIVIAVSGRVNARDVRAQVERLFGAMPARSAPVAAPPRPPAPTAGREALMVPGAQAQIVLGSLAPKLTDPDFAAMKVLSAVLGGGMAGRFFSELRDQQGLAYTSAAQYATRVDDSLFMAQIGTAPETAAKTEAALKEQLTRIQREPVSAEELRVAQAYLLGSLEMDRRSNARQAWYLASYETMGVGYEFLDRYVIAVRDVTSADVQRVARRYLAVLQAVVVDPPAQK